MRLHLFLLPAENIKKIKKLTKETAVILKICMCATKSMANGAMRKKWDLQSTKKTSMRQQRVYLPTEQHYIFTSITEKAEEIFFRVSYRVRYGANPKS